MASKKSKKTDHDLIGKIYEAALNPDLWPSFISEFAIRIKAEAGILSFHNVEEMELLFIKSHGRDATLFDKYREYFIKINPYLNVVKEIPYTVFSSTELIDEKKLTETEYYNDWLLPQSIHYHIGAIIFRDSARLAMVDMQRSLKAGAFGTDELEQIKIFEPHLRRALVINQKFWDLLANPAAATTILDNLEIGVIFLDETVRPVYLNRKAEDLTKSGEGVVLRSDGLSTEWPEQAKALKLLAYESVQTGLGKGLSPGGVIRVGILPEALHNVLITPFRTEKNDLGLTGFRICAAVFISSPSQPHAVSVESLKNMFELTSAEARLVSELANGITLEEISDKFEITKNTVRDQLKSIFSKVNTRRQTDLINLVKTSPSALISEGVLIGSSLGGPLDRRKFNDRRSPLRAKAETTPPA